MWIIHHASKNLILNQGCSQKYNNNENIHVNRTHYIHVTIHVIRLSSTFIFYRFHIRKVTLRDTAGNRSYQKSFNSMSMDFISTIPIPIRCVRKIDMTVNSTTFKLKQY